jgi:hypothetical protein
MSGLVQGVELPWWLTWVLHWVWDLLFVRLPRGARAIAGLQCTATFKVRPPLCMNNLEAN